MSASHQPPIHPEPGLATPAGALAPPVPQGIEWRELVAGIKAGDDAAMAKLYALFNKGTRYYLARQLGTQELEDKVHDNFLVAVNAIQRGDLREPERLMGFMRTVARRQVAGEIEKRVHARRNAEMDAGYAAIAPDKRTNPEQALAQTEKQEITEAILDKLREDKREILTRFYIEEQPKEQIIREMGLRKDGES